jgi:replicative DNA helicase
MQSFKESGAIEYSSDVLIGLQLEGAGNDSFDATAAKRKNPRDIELVVLKNRNGRVGDKIKYQYYPMFNFFHENGQKIDEEKKAKKMI